MCLNLIPLHNGAQIHSRREEGILSIPVPLSLREQIECRFLTK